MSRQHAQQKLDSRHALHEIFILVKYLCRQGLPFRGDKEEKDGNLNQLLYMKAEKDAILANWLKRKENVYKSPTIQNEIIKLMGLSILRNIVADLQKAPFLAIMADETTDTSNREQVTLFLRWVTDTLDVNEEFLGLYHVDSIEAARIAMVITDVFQRYGLSLGRLRGQCYDGASAMSGSRSGVAKRILDLEPKAFFVHCYGHALNLSACDTLKQCKVLCDALETTHEITKLIKYSPRREAIFQKVKESLPSESPSTGAGIRILCPTRWTVRAVSLKSIIDNFDVLKDTWDKAMEVVEDSETKARIRGISFQMSTFDYLFGNLLGQLMLNHVHNLSSTLQHKSMSAAEGQVLAKMTIETLKSICDDKFFDLFWESTKKEG